MRRSMPAIALRIVLAGVLLQSVSACASTTTSSVPGSVPPRAEELPRASGPFGVGVTCPGDQWPPPDLTGIEGITAVASDRATVVITNRTKVAWSYRLDAWEVARLDTCVGLLAQEIQRGPLPPGGVVEASIPSFAGDGPLTIAFWDRPCGEACNRDPEHPMLIERSALEPASS